MDEEAGPIFLQRADQAPQMAGMVVREDQICYLHRFGMDGWKGPGPIG
jgi:hypothetical protein